MKYLPMPHEHIASLSGLLRDTELFISIDSQTSVASNLENKNKIKQLILNLFKIKFYGN